MEWMTALLSRHPELGVYLALAIGYWIGARRIFGFTLGGVTGSASGMFHAMLTEDLHQARELGLVSPTAPVDEIAVLVSGAIREIGARVASDPSQAEALLYALRLTCAALITPTDT